MHKQLAHWLAARSRRGKQAILVGTDISLFIAAVWLSYTLRLSEFHSPSYQQFLLMLFAPAIGVPVLYLFGLYRTVTRYLGDYAIWTGIKAVTLTAFLWGMVAIIFRTEGSTTVPRSVLVLFWLLSIALVAGVRYLARWLLITYTQTRLKRRSILIYGAGVAGRQIAATLSESSDRNTIFQVDEDRGLWGTIIDGQKIHSPDEITQLIGQYGITEAIVTMRSAATSRRTEVVDRLSSLGLHVRILPAFVDIADGKHTVNMIRDVDIGDLLGRDVVPPDIRLMEANTKGKVVMVTGAGGSIGSELCRQVASIGAAKLVLLDSSELALYQINGELTGFSSVRIVPILGSVMDAAFIRRTILEHNVDTIFHAAAYKHVPLVELNPFAGIRNNVFGTWNVAIAAFESSVTNFVLISSDKAVRPTNVMGASKRLAEMIVQRLSDRAHSEKRDKVFLAVRFGNVIGSSGSVIPLFREQIRNGGPITVTHFDVTRYFMSIEEAAQLVIQAGGLARDMDRTVNSGRIFLLDMGKPIKIRDLAIKMVQLSNLTICDEENPNGDISIIEIGLRPGEKLHEELFISIDTSTKTAHPRISVAPEMPPVSYDMESVHYALDDLIDRNDKSGLLTLLQIQAGMRPSMIGENE
jgi:FlaA1/EpsC-like NDP-sugar epimerase